MNKKALDELGVAIANAGYVWTPEMRKAYEKGIRKSKWVGLTDEERDECINGTAWVGEEKEVRVKIVEAVESKLKEKNT